MSTLPPLRPGEPAPDFKLPSVNREGTVLLTRRLPREVTGAARHDARSLLRLLPASHRPVGHDAAKAPEARRRDARNRAYAARAVAGSTIASDR